MALYGSRGRARQRAYLCIYHPCEHYQTCTFLLFLLLLIPQDLFGRPLPPTAGRPLASDGLATMRPVTPLSGAHPRYSTTPSWVTRTVPSISTGGITKHDSRDEIRRAKQRACEARRRADLNSSFDDLGAVLAALARPADGRRSQERRRSAHL